MFTNINIVPGNALCQPKMYPVQGIVYDNSILLITNQNKAFLAYISCPGNRGGTEQVCIVSLASHFIVFDASNYIHVAKLLHVLEPLCGGTRDRRDLGPGRRRGGAVGWRPRGGHMLRRLLPGLRRRAGTAGGGGAALWTILLASREARAKTLKITVFC